MCGIVGLINPKRAALENINNICKGMLGLLTHRGPDQAGLIHSPFEFLGCTRLSLIDLENGIQPIANEDESVWIVFNGEIYDVDEHITHLKKKGHRFRTRTDTEVVVHLYEQFGLEFVNHLNGEFAFCIWDRRLNRTILVRDPYGCKPLYYRTLKNGATFFASEIKPLLWAVQESASINPEAVSQTMMAWAVIPPTTSLKNVSQLPPGTMTVIENGQWRQMQFSYERVPRKPGTSEELEALLEESVKKRMKADVPIGVYLSGGLDSSIISILASRYSEKTLSTFSIEFEDPQFDESCEQNAVSEMLGTQHHSIRISTDDIVSNFASAVLSAESIVFRSALVPTYLLAKRVREKNQKAVLSGEGADELFGGYDIYKELLILQAWRRAPESLTIPEQLSSLYPHLPEFSPKKLRFLIPYYKNFLEKAPFWGHQVRWAGYHSNRKMLLPEWRDANTRNQLAKLLPNKHTISDEDECRMVEILTLLHGYLLSSQGDRMASAHSVELRLPFLDKEVSRFALSQSVSNYIVDNVEKAPLRRLFEKNIPTNIRTRKKKPFLAPDCDVFFRSCLKGWKDYITPGSLARMEVFEVDGALERLSFLKFQIDRNLPVTRHDHTFFFSLLSSTILQEEMSLGRLQPKNILNMITREISLTSAYDR